MVSAAVAGAIRHGYRLFDCASVYGNEDQIGKIFEQAFADGVVKREELFITSKVWNDMHGKGDVFLSLAKTLRDLRLEYVDAYFVHWPFPNYHAPGCDGDARNPDSVPFSAERFMQTWREMEKIYRLGLARHICMSNMTISILEAVLPLCAINPGLIEM
jgi:alcohol dehydrogenase (NADP+)